MRECKRIKSLTMDALINLELVMKCPKLYQLSCLVLFILSIHVDAKSKF